MSLTENVVFDRRAEADAKAAREEARRGELEQRLVAAEAARAGLESKVREAERLAEKSARAFEEAMNKSEAKAQALVESAAQVRTRRVLRLGKLGYAEALLAISYDCGLGAAFGFS